MPPQQAQVAPDIDVQMVPAAKERALSQNTRARLALLAAGALLLCIGFWLWSLWHAVALHQGRYDFSQYYAAGIALRQNPHADIYSRALLSSSGVAAHVLAPITFPYPYPPFSAILFAPLSLVSFPTAAAIFLIINVGFWLACMLLIAGEIHHILGTSLAASNTPGTSPVNGLWERVVADPAPLIALAVSSLLLFVSRPATQTLGNGQINFVVLLPLAAIPWLTRHRHERWVGGAVAIAAMLKVTPVLLLGYLILRRRWEALGAAIAALVALALASLVVVGPDVFFQSLTAILHIGGADMALRNNESVLGPAINALTAAGAVSVAHVLQYLLLATLAAGIGLLVWRPGQRAAVVPPSEQDDVAESLAYGVALPAVVLLSPVAWAHHYLWLAPSLAIVVAVALRAWAEGRAPLPRQAASLLLLAALACVLINLPLPNGWDTDPAASGLLFGLPLRPWFQELRPLGGLILVAVAATLLLRTRSDSVLRIPVWIRQRPNRPTAQIPETPTLPASRQ